MFQYMQFLHYQNWMAREKARFFMASGTCQPPSSATDARPPRQHEDGVHRSRFSNLGLQPWLRTLSEHQPSGEDDGGDDGDFQLALCSAELATCQLAQRRPISHLRRGDTARSGGRDGSEHGEQ